MTDKLKIEYVPIMEIRPNEYNPKQMTKKEAEDLEKSIVRFGIVDPLIINSAENRKGIIIGGHQRYNIYQKLKYEEVPVVWVDIPDLEKEKELCLRLSKNTGSWDHDLLGEIEENILSEVGFGSDELDMIFGLDEQGDIDKVPELPEEPKSRMGDIYQLGEHRLMCGDATKKEDVEKLMDGKKADMVFADPPYNIGFGYNEYKDKLNNEKYLLFCKKWFDNLSEIKKIIITPGPRNLNIWEQIKKPDDIGIWLKRNTRSGATVFHLRTSEPILFWGKFKKRNLDIFEYNMCINNGLRSAQNKSGVLKSHPPGKPVALLTDIIKSFSERNDVIVDIFGGNGTTLIASERLNRKCYMMEIDIRYCDVIIERWENITNKKAIKTVI